MCATPVSTSVFRRAARRLLPVVLACQAGAASAFDMDYLRSLLDATPVGGWVQANINKFSDAVASGASALPDQSSTNVGSIVRPWSSLAWDTRRGQLYMWGGGHASYIGNEMHVWSASSGAWSLGSLPSRIEYIANAEDPRTWLVVDDAAPQSAHTFDGAIYLPVNDYYLTFGGAVYNASSYFQTRDGQGNLIEAGPWLWDPRKANANQVGGTTGSGYDPTVTGGEMWINRQGQSTGDGGLPGTSYLMNTSAYRTENGRDVVYVTKFNSGGYPDLYKFTVGDVRNGGLDHWERVGVAANVLSGESTAVLDSVNNLYVQTAFVATEPGGFEFRVWDLDLAGAANLDIGVQLVDADGNQVRLTVGAGIGYNDRDGTLWLWDGTSKGTVWRTRARYNADGSLATQWLVETLTLPDGAPQPSGDFFHGVFGKWLYVNELGAFVAMDDYDFETSLDAPVWLYKTDDLSLPVPEVGTAAMMLAGVGALALLGVRRRRAS